EGGAVVESARRTGAGRRGSQRETIAAPPVVVEPLSKPIEPVVETAPIKMLPPPAAPDSAQPVRPPVQEQSLTAAHAQPEPVVEESRPAPEPQQPEKAATPAVVNPGPPPAPQTSKAQSKRKRRGLRGQRDKLRSNAAPPKPPTPVVPAPPLPAPPVPIPMPSFSPLPGPQGSTPSAASAGP